MPNTLGGSLLAVQNEQAALAMPYVIQGHARGAQSVAVEHIRAWGALVNHFLSQWAVTGSISSNENTPKAYLSEKPEPVLSVLTYIVTYSYFIPFRSHSCESK